MADPRSEALQSWAGAYGALCTTAARALHDGYAREEIRCAALGQAVGHHPVHRLLRKQRGEMSGALERAIALGVTRGDVIEHGLRVKHAVEGEWGQKIPIVSGGARDAS